MSAATLILVLTVIQAAALAAGILFVLWMLFLALPGLFKGPPYLGARPEYVEEALALAELQPGQTVIDLGSGDGRLLLAAASRGCRAVGYEINLFLVWLSRLKAAWVRPAGSVTVHWRDFFRADLADADVVLLYSVDQAMVRLAERLWRELRPGSRVVTLRYPISGRRPDRSGRTAFLYVVGPPA